MKAPLSKTEFYNRKIEDRITERQTAREREDEEKRKESILDKNDFYLPVENRS